MTHLIRQAACTIFAMALLSCSGSASKTEDVELVGKPETTQMSDTAQPVNRGTLWYQLSVGDNALNAAVRLYSPGETTRFFLPGVWRGHSDYADRIRIAGAQGENGPRFMTIDRRSGHIDVSAKPDDEWIELRYRVDLTPSNGNGRFHPRFQDGVLVAYAPTVLLLPSQQVLNQTRDIPIQVTFPKTWNVLSTWSLARSATSKVNDRNRAYQFMAYDPRALGDAYIVAGPNLAMEQRLQGNDQISVGYPPSFRGDRPAIADSVSTLVQRYRKRFGHLGPVSVYVDPVPSKTAEYDGLGRRGGFVLLLPPAATSNEATTLLIAHEAFHLWNGHHIVPEPSDEQRTRWFKEGVTQWIAVRSACLSDAFGRNDALNEIASVVTSYLANPIVQGKSGKELDKLRLPYDQGFLLAMMIDGRLARASNRRIEDWINAITKGNLTFDLAGLQRALLSTANGDPKLRSLWSAHVLQNQPIDVGMNLRNLGLHYIRPTSDTPPRVIPLEGESPLYEELLNTCTED